MAMKAHRFVGFDRDVFLPDDIEVVIDIVPDSMIGWVRSGVRETGHTTTTFHDTGASGQSARAQRNYLHNGPTYKDEETGQIRRRKVGFNFAVDDTRIIQLTPLNEVTWAAGTATGNRTSWHTEQCFGGSINFERSLRNAIALHAGLIQAKGWSADSALVKHQYWYGKWCPGQILNKGIWNSVARRVDEAARGAGGNGGQPNVPTTFSAPVPVPELAPFRDGDLDSTPAMVRADDGTPFFFVADRVKATSVTPRLQLANPNSPRVGPDLKVGEEFDVLWIFESSADNDLYYITPFDTRIKVADTVRIGDRPGPEPAPMDNPEEAIPGDGAPIPLPDDLLPPIDIIPFPEEPEPAGFPGAEDEEPTPDEEAPGH